MLSRAGWLLFSLQGHGFKHVTADFAAGAALWVMRLEMQDVFARAGWATRFRAAGFVAGAAAGFRGTGSV